MHAGVWHHGDFMVKNPKTQGLIILGRRSVITSVLPYTHLKYRPS